MPAIIKTEKYQIVRPPNLAFYICLTLLGLLFWLGLSVSKYIFCIVLIVILCIYFISPSRRAPLYTNNLFIYLFSILTKLILYCFFSVIIVISSFALVFVAVDYEAARLGHEHREMAQWDMQVPKEYRSSMSENLMADPVYDKNYPDMKFDRAEILHHLEYMAPPENPITHTPLKVDGLVSDEVLKNKIDDFLSKAPPRPQEKKSSLSLLYIFLAISFPLLSLSSFGVLVFYGVVRPGDKPIQAPKLAGRSPDVKE